MQRIAKFEKVSFEQFKKDWQGEHPQDTEEVIREIYDGIRLPKRATAGSAGYDSFAPAAFTLKPGEMTKILTGIRRGSMTAGIKALSEKRTLDLSPSAVKQYRRDHRQRLLRI